MKNIRNKNISVLRHLYDGLGKLAVELAPLVNEASLIKMGQGQKELTEQMAREIEAKLKLPNNWMDRENDELLLMSALDYRLFMKISLMENDRKRSLEILISQP